MTASHTAIIHLEGDVDFRTAQGLTARIRAAMQNGLTRIELHLAPETTISSAEFVGFLASAARHLDSEEGALRIRGATGRTRSLLAISRLEHLLDDGAA